MKRSELEVGKAYAGRSGRRNVVVALEPYEDQTPWMSHGERRFVKVEKGNGVLVDQTWGYADDRPYRKVTTLGSLVEPYEDYEARQKAKRSAYTRAEKAKAALTAERQARRDELTGRLDAILGPGNRGLVVHEDRLGITPEDLDKLLARAGRS